MLQTGLLLILLCRAASSVFIKNNATDLSRCKVYYSRTGSTYKDFFEITENNHSKGTLLDFHFSVLAASDAHILLAPSPDLQKDDPVYEVVIGAGGNTFSDIRRAQKAQVMASTRSPGVLSAVDVRSFWLHISLDGLMEVGKEGDEVAFLSWQDTDPLPLRVFSFSTWRGVEAKWYFDCPNEANKTGDSKIIPRNLTHVERLRKDLLYNYDPYFRPVLDPKNSTVISLILQFHYVNLDVLEGQLSIKGTVKMQWQDEKLKWDPVKYGNLSSLHVYDLEIWKPTLTLYNAVESTEEYISKDALAIVSNKGKVSWSPSVDIRAWCNPEYGAWPNDVHSCILIFGLVEYRNVKLNFLSNSSTLIGKTYVTGWRVSEVETGAHNGSENNYSFFGTPMLYMTLELEMSSNFYYTVFYATLIVGELLLLSSFCVCPMGYLKLSLNSFQLILTSLTVVALASYVPPQPDKIPYLVFQHVSLLTAGVIAVAINIIVINISRNEHRHSLPRTILNILTSRWVTFLLLLPGKKLEGSSEYGKLKDDTSSNVMSGSQDTWILLGIVVDRLAFVAFLCFIITSAVLKY